MDTTSYARIRQALREFFGCVQILSGLMLVDELNFHHLHWSPGLLDLLLTLHYTRASIH